MLFVAAAMAATFLLVPRGFSAGEIDIQSDHMSWNTTKGTYQLNLLARIPINNPNFLHVRAPPAMLACHWGGPYPSHEVPSGDVVCDMADRFDAGSASCAVNACVHVHALAVCLSTLQLIRLCAWPTPTRAFPLQCPGTVMCRRP